ncbi:hypothetical protein N7520_002045 [Penicillium odoratum]|uniref:uncharacterized protein n=1 Tax=Penicillium odoratum TaxID=1167516 RepID=UPI002548C395|nr:uncharacterized protein N7520_002045 [Penicillium odoratum]KAJ5778799.1 hypothetical protein N7520_002045 [Penicillium odoratum]
MSDPPKKKNYSKGSSKTCRNCAKAKIRCIRHRATGSCDRRIDALETKVDQLLLQSGTRSLRDGSMTNGPPVSVAAIGPAPCTDVIDQGLLTIDAANVLLRGYRTTLALYCPFVIVPPQVNAEMLRRDKPFLFLALITAALYDNMPLQRKLEIEMKKAISECMVGGGQISFETLQGLLVHISWCQYHSRPRRYAQYLNLAISVITDLQLDRSPEHRFWTTRVSFDGDDDKDTVSWGREEKRAVIGCFYFSSAISQILQKRFYFPYLPYLESIGVDLTTDPEYASDKYFLYIVRLQRISEKIALYSAPNFPEPSKANNEHSYDELKAELSLYQTNLPFPLTENHILFTNFHAVQLCLCQISVFDHNLNAQSMHHSLPYQIDALRMGLVVSKTLLEFYISLPLRHDVAFNNAIWVQLGFAATLACKLSVAAMRPSVHPHTFDLCRAFDISKFLSRCILRIQALVTPDMDASGDRDVFYHYEKRLKRVQWWFGNRALCGLNNDSSKHDIPLGESLSSSTVAESQYLDASQPPMEVFDPHLQWPGLFPDASIDELFVDWAGQTTSSFEQQHMA